ncbi:MAG: hypothetical protein QXL10_00960 [Candidatus Bathyarchaeia archaeon]
MAALSTVVHHVCEKPGDIHVPDVAGVYRQILAANAGKYPTVLLLPEYAGHLDWSAELDWIADNFGGQDGIPIMLDVFGGGGGQTPTPQLTTEQIEAAMAVANVKWLRFAEVVSWHIEHQQPFPEDYVAEVLSFCRANNLKLFWCEWKVDYALGKQGEVRTFDLIRELIEGYEDIVVVGFKTNSGDLEPDAGFAYVAGMFEHWGAVVESWYWETRHRTQVWEPREGLESPDNMPVSWMVCHANEARSRGAELIQFEPYWYFFGVSDGKAKDSLKTVHYYLNSGMAMMETCTVILETLRAEWLLDSPAKNEIEWLDGRAETGWYMQPSAYNFMQMAKKYAVCCYSVGTANPNPNLWLKVDVVAVEVLVKAVGMTLERAVRLREAMRCEVERILHRYSKVAPLWDPNPGPTGAYKHRRIPGLRDVVIGQVIAQQESPSLVRVAVQVRCRLFPKNSWSM